MKFCSNCGEKTTEMSLYCQNCGEKLPMESNDDSTLAADSLNNSSSSETKSTSSTQAVISQQSPQTASKKPMSTSTKVLMGVLIGLIALIFGAKYVIDQKYDPQKQLKEIHEAFIDEDQKAFYTYFEIPKGTVGDEERFYNWIDEAGWSTVRKSISEELKKLEKDEPMDPIAINYEDALRLKEEKILFGLAKKVTYSIRPLELSLSTNFENTTVTIEDKEFEVGTEKKEIGKFIYGTYNSQYVVKGPYMDLTGKLDISVYPDEYDNYAYYSYDVDYNGVELSSNRENAIVYINGESTGKTVSELHYISPVSFTTDSKVYLVDKDEQGNEIKSDEYGLNDDYIQFEFEFDRDLEFNATLVKFYTYYRDEFMAANNSADFSYISEFFEEQSQIYNDYKKFVEDHSAIDFYYYTPITNEVTKVEKLSENEYMLYATEEFDFVTEEETINYLRDKSYKIKVRDDNSAVFTEIKDLNTKKSNK